MNNNLYKVEKVNEHIFRIIGPTDEFSYVINGKNSSLLIDTCCGVEGFKEIVDSIVLHPYEVVLTHGHVDHAGGCGAFRTNKIYLSSKDFSMAKIHMSKFVRKIYVSSSNKILKVKKDISSYIYVDNSKVKFVSLNDNDVFDLGDIHVHTYALPGHTKGMMTLLIEEDKLLLLGDSCNPSTFLFFPEALKISEYVKSLEAYIERTEGKYEHIILSHLPFTCDKYVCNQMVSLCKDILNGRKNEDKMRILFNNVKVAKKINPETGFNNDMYSANLFYKKVN